MTHFEPQSQGDTEGHCVLLRAALCLCLRVVQKIQNESLLSNYFIKQRIIVYHEIF
jgi:hypothetical protein